ncbi:MAG: hypothetical protein ACRBK7_06520 [Acidimicrobiales bacterium]
MTEEGPVSTRRINAAAKLLAEPDELKRVIAKLDDQELTNLASVVSHDQSKRAVARGDLDEIIAHAFESGFGTDGLAIQPWVEGTVVVCPGGLIYSGRNNHVCRFVSVNDTWIWDSYELIREDKRSTPGVKDGFRAVGLLPTLEGMTIDYVCGKARSGQHAVDKVFSYVIKKGKLVEVSQRNVSKTGMK